MKNIDKTQKFIEEFRRKNGVAPRQIDIAKHFTWSRAYVRNLFALYKDELGKIKEYELWYYNS